MMVHESSVSRKFKNFWLGCRFVRGPFDLLMGALARQGAYHEYR